MELTIPKNLLRTGKSLLTKSSTEISNLNLKKIELEQSKTFGFHVNGGSCHENAPGRKLLKNFLKCFQQSLK